MSVDLDPHTAQSALAWILGDDTGSSSLTLCAFMVGIPRTVWADVPSDAYDFGRCYRLLQQFPAWRLRLPEMGEHYATWKPLVGAWGELTLLYEAEQDCVLTNRLKELRGVK